METIFQDSDPLKVAWLQTLLQREGIESVILDQGTNMLYSGAVGGIGSRLTVLAKEEAPRALEIIKEALGEDA